MTAARVKWIAAIMTLLVVLLAFWPSFDEVAGPMDEGSLLVYPELVQHGAVPYRDFETFYGPANPWLLSAVYSIFGNNITVERSVGLVYRLLIVSAVFVITQRWGAVTAVGSALLAGCLLTITDIAAFAWMGGVAAALWSIVLASRSGSTRSLFASGVLAGLALLFRADLGPAMIGAAVVLLWGTPWRSWRMFAVGAAVGLLPLAFVVAIAGVRPVIDNLFVLPVLKSSPGRHLPLVTVAPFLRRLLFFHLGAVSFELIVAAIVLARQRLADSGGARLLLATTIFAGAITHQAVQRLDFIHFVFAAFLSFALLPVAFAVAVTALHRPIRFEWAAVVATILVAAMLALVARPLFQLVARSFTLALGSTPAPVTFVSSQGRSFPIAGPRAALATQQLIDYLAREAAPGQRLFVGPGDLRRTGYNDTFLYHLLPQLRPATYFLEMNPLSANASGSRLAADIATADWLVLDRGLDSAEEPNAAKQYGPDEPNAVVRQQFTPVQEFRSYKVFRKNQ